MKDTCLSFISVLKYQYESPWEGFNLFKVAFIQMVQAVFHEVLSFAVYSTYF